MFRKLVAFFLTKSCRDYRRSRFFLFSAMKRGILEDNAPGWKIALKISQLPSKLRFSANCSFFGQSFSLGHYPQIYQAPEWVYLLIIQFCLLYVKTCVSKALLQDSISKLQDSFFLFLLFVCCCCCCFFALFIQLHKNWQSITKWTLKENLSIKEEKRGRGEMVTTRWDNAKKENTIMHLCTWF